MIYISPEQKQRICDTLKIADCSMSLFNEAVRNVKGIDWQNDCCNEEDMQRLKDYIEENRQ